MSGLSQDRDRALDELTTQFPGVPVRIVIDIFRYYLASAESVSAAAAATRERIIDACMAA